MSSRLKILFSSNQSCRGLLAGFNTRFLLIVLIVGSLTGCGFQLRKDTAGSLPDGLKVIKLNLQVDNNVAVLKNMFVDEWALAGGNISESDDVPELLINGERVIQRVLSVSPANAKVSEYSLKYAISFQLTTPDKKKKPIVKTIYLQRQYTVDTTNVLAKEHEQKWLKNAMRQQAIKIIVRKLSHLDAELFSENITSSVPEVTEVTGGK